MMDPKSPESAPPPLWWQNASERERVGPGAATLEQRIRLESELFGIFQRDPSALKLMEDTVVQAASDNTATAQGTRSAVTTQVAAVKETTLQSPTPQYKPTTEQVMILDENDLKLILKPHSVDMIKKWAEELRVAQDKPLILGYAIRDIAFPFSVSVADLLEFDGTKTSAESSRCVVPMPRSDSLNLGPVIVTGAFATVTGDRKELCSQFKESIKIGSSLNEEFLEHHSRLMPKVPLHAKFLKLKANRPDQLHGLVGTLERPQQSIVVPPITEALMVEYGDMGLVTRHEVLRHTATLPRYDNNGATFVIVPERHGLVTVLKKHMLSHVATAMMVASVNPLEGHPLFLLLSKTLFDTMCEEAVKQSAFLCPSTELPKHNMFLAYKYKGEEWLDTQEMSRLRDLGTEKMHKRHDVTMKLTVEYYKRAEGVPWRARKGAEGRFPPGLPIIDIVSGLASGDMNKLAVIKQDTIDEFYKEQTDRKLVKLTRSALLQSFLRRALYGEKPKTAP